MKKEEKEEDIIPTLCDNFFADIEICGFQRSSSGINPTYFVEEHLLSLISLKNR